MATATAEHAVEAEHGHDDHDHHPTDKTYWVVGAVLALITAAEVSMYFITDDPYSHPQGTIIIGALLFMMVVKFIVILAYFMHLKFDNKLFRWMFVAGLVLAAAVYAVVFFSFNYWWDEYEGIGEAALALLA